MLKFERPGRGKWQRRLNESRQFIQEILTIRQWKKPDTISKFLRLRRAVKTAAPPKKFTPVPRATCRLSMEQYGVHSFAPGLVGTFQDSEGGGGRHRSSPPPIGVS